MVRDQGITINYHCTSKRLKPGIHANIFIKFKDENGNFKNDLISNVRGMLGLYEAAYMRVQGEDILDEALAFTTTHLTF